MSNTDLAIFFCVAATVMLRILPFLKKRSKPFPRWIEDFLSFVPYTALGALTIPGVLNTTSDVRVSAAGFMAALTVSIKRGGMIGPIVSGVGTTFMLLLISRFV